MHLIDVTNTYRDLIERQLSSTSSQYIKVYSLGNITVVYTETSTKIEIVLENHRRGIHEDEIYNISMDQSRKIISITCDK